jgi:hypothetical protein
LVDQESAGQAKDALGGDTSDEGVKSGQDRQSIALERYKARLNFWKSILISGFAAVVIAYLPPHFQYETARLEDARKLRELAHSKTTFHDTYVKDFFNEALKQDIEVRIRLAMYFARVADNDYKEDWRNYLKDLTDLRGQIRQEINDRETKLNQLQQAAQDDLPARAQLSRELQWRYGELGYAEPNRDVGSVKAFSFSPALSNFASVSAQLDTLRSDEQFMALAKAMEPRLANRSPAIQQLVKTIDPGGLRLSGDGRKARQVIKAWAAEDEMTPANRRQWLDAITSASSAATPTTQVDKFRKGSLSRADVDKIQKSRLASGARSSVLTEDDANWILTTVWPGD